MRARLAPEVVVPDDLTHSALARSHAAAQQQQHRAALARGVDPTACSTQL